MRIRVNYLLSGLIQTKPDWPNAGFDFRPVIENFNAVLRKEFPSIEFISSFVMGREDALKTVVGDQGEKIDGYIVYQLNTQVNNAAPVFVESQKPVLYVNFKYGGTGRFLGHNSEFINDNLPNVGFVSSSQTDDILAAVKCFETSGSTGKDFATATALVRLKRTPAPGNLSCKVDPVNTITLNEWQSRMKESKILAIRDQNPRPAEPVMGISLEYLSFAEVNQAWESADKDEADAVAEKWKNNASQIIDVPFDELQNSAAFYLGMKSVLKKHNANAITINCLGGFYGNHIHAYPCLGFHELNNEGLVGACECDIRSTATMVAFSEMTKGRPGYISDPEIDTSKRQIIYAHCVAPNKMFGPEGPTNPFSILTHSEDRQGAAVRSILPEGYLTTSLKINSNTKEILFHQAKTVGNDPDDRACRTKLCAEPIGDIEKLITKWSGGWHRVTFYGDIKEQVYGLADFIEWKVIEEA